MALTESQKVTLSGWLTQGCTLSEVQTQLKSEFDITMTFIEVRFLIDDLDLELKKDQPVEATDDAETVAAEVEPETGVSIEVDVIVTPGAMVSGDVRFSDGVKAKWQVDQSGRLGLTGMEEGYQPSPADVQEFQSALQSELQKKGMV